MEIVNTTYTKVMERDKGTCCVCKKNSKDITLQTKCTFQYQKFFSGEKKPTAADVVTVCKNCSGQYAELRRIECRATAKGSAPVPYLQLTAAGWIEQR